MTELLFTRSSVGTSVGGRKNDQPSVEIRCDRSVWFVELVAFGFTHISIVNVPSPDIPHIDGENVTAPVTPSSLAAVLPSFESAPVTPTVTPESRYDPGARSPFSST